MNARRYLNMIIKIYCYQFVVGTIQVGTEDKMTLIIGNVLRVIKG